jgi:putative phosphoribosyl transferase
MAPRGSRWNMGQVERTIAMTRVFEDRVQAGRALARQLLDYRGATNAIVLALPRGGVPVGFEIAQALGLPLDVLVVRKLGLPGQPELAMGAIASGGALVLNEDVLRFADGREADLEQVRRREQLELERRERQYRGARPPLQMSGCTAILVDDGLATGATMEVAVRALRGLAAGRIVVAVPVASREARDRIAAVADEVVCLEVPTFFSAVGQWYRDFGQTSDAQVSELLAQSCCGLGADAPGALA